MKRIVYLLCGSAAALGLMGVVSQLPAAEPAAAATDRAAIEALEKDFAAAFRARRAAAAARRLGGVQEGLAGAVRRLSGTGQVRRDRSRDHVRRLRRLQP